MSIRLLPLILLAACIGGSEGADSGPSDGACAALGESDCAARSDCLALYGAPIDEVCESDTWGSVWAGCVDDPGGCDDAIGCAEDPDDGTQLIFSSLCFPEGWTECETCP